MRSRQPAPDAVAGDEALPSHEVDALTALIAHESDRRLWQLVTGYLAGLLGPLRKLER